MNAETVTGFAEGGFEFGAAVNGGLDQFHAGVGVGGEHVVFEEAGAGVGALVPGNDPGYRE